MKSLQDLNIDIIKDLKNKEGSEKIKNIHYKINGDIYNVKRRPLSKCAVVRIAKKLKNYQDQLKDIDCTSKTSKKRDEICHILNDYLNTLRAYYKEVKYTPEDVQTAQKVLNFQLSSYLRNKEKIEKDDMLILQTLQVNKETLDDYVCIDEAIEPSKAYKQMQEDLIKIIKEKYMID